MGLGTIRAIVWAVLVVPAISVVALGVLTALLLLELSQIPEVEFATSGRIVVQETDREVFIPLRITRPQSWLGVASQVRPSMVLQLDVARENGAASSDIEVQKERTIDPAEPRPALRLKVADNATVDPRRSFLIRLLGVKGGRLGKVDTVEVELKDDERVAIHAEVPPCIEVSGRTSYSLPVRLSAPCAFPTRLVFKTRDGDAQAGRHYEPLAGEVILSPREQAWSLELHLLEGSVVRGSKQFFVDLSLFHDGKRLTSVEIPVTLGFPGNSVELEIASVRWQVSAETKEVIVPLRLAQVRSEPITILVSTEDGSAKAGRHFTAVEKEITFQPGQLTSQLVVPLLLVPPEGGEASFSVVARGGKDSAEVLAQGRVTLVYVPPPPMLRVPDRLELSPPAGQQQELLIEYTLTGPVRESASFQYQSIREPNQPPFVELAEGTVTLSSGQTKGQLPPIRIRGLPPGASDATFKVRLFNPVNVRLETNEISVIVRPPRGLKGTAILVVPLTESVEAKWEKLREALGQIVDKAQPELVGRAIWFVDFAGDLTAWTGGVMPQGAVIRDEDFGTALERAIGTVLTLANQCEQPPARLRIIWLSELNPDFGDLGRTVDVPSGKTFRLIWVRDEIPGGRLPSVRLREWFGRENITETTVDDLLRHND